MNEYEPLDGALTTEPETERFPWPPAEQESVLTAFADSWRGAALEPARFFRSMPERAPVGPALLYYLPLGIAVAGATMFWSLVGLNISALSRVAGIEATSDAMSPVIDFLMSPLILLVSLFVSAGVTHLMLLMFGAGKNGFGTTGRVFAFAYSPQILAVIPWVGQAVGMVWMVVIAIIGLREAHRTSTGRAVAAVLIPFLVAVLFIVASMFILAASSLLLPQ